MGSGDEGPQQDADRASRIAARCKRIQEKLAAARQGDSAGAQEVAQQQGMTRTMAQLLQSSKRLLKLKHETQQAVTAVKVQGDEQESLRRQKDERMRQDLRAALLAEAEAAAAANSAISGRWAGVLGHNVPQDMFGAIEQQRLACEAVIACKDRLIADIRTALKGKDEEYVKLLKRQAADVDGMLSAMGQQLSQLTAAYREELLSVEGVLLQERAELLAGNRKEVGVLLEARQAAESTFTDKYLAAVETYAQNLELLRHADAEDYQVLKIKLESDIAVLEQHLETMRATYQLNAEKLEYNYRVLLERDAENTATINQQKRKLSRQHDVLLNLKGKYSRGDGKFCDENSKVTEEYKRITEHFKDMQAKFCHFGRVDMAKFTQLWQMQQREACSLVQQLLAADRVIHEQQLGWQWQPPDESLFVSPHDAAALQANSSPRTQQAASSSAGAAAAAAAGSMCGSSSRGGSLSGAGAGALSSPTGSRQPSSSGGVLLGSPTQAGLSGSGCKEGLLAGGRRSSSAAGSSQRRASSGGASSVAGAAAPGLQLHSPAEVLHRLTAPHYYGALCLLVDEAGFLVESKVAALLAELPANEAKLVAAESIVRALGVTDGPSFDALMEALTATGSAADSTGRSGSNPGGVPVLVHPSDALLRLKQFVEAESGISQPSAAQQQLGASSRTATAAAAGNTASKGGRIVSGSTVGSNTVSSGSSPKAAGSLLAFQGGQVVSRRAADREREYWERLTKAVGDRVVRVWAKLEQQLGAYHKLLVSRGEGLAAISHLQQENEELRGLLNQYLGSKINAELQVPPMAVLL